MIFNKIDIKNKTYKIQYNCIIWVFNYSSKWQRPIDEKCKDTILEKQKKKQYLKFYFYQYNNKRFQNAYEKEAVVN